MECEARPGSLLSFQNLVDSVQATTREMQLQTSGASMWPAVAALQALDRTVDTLTGRLLHLEGRMVSAEKKLEGSQRSPVERENQEESGGTALSSLLEKHAQLQRRLENMENLLKNRNFWILRFPPGAKGETPKVPITFHDLSVYFNEQEWEGLNDLQKELYRTVMRSNYETLVSLDYAVSKPDLLTRIEQREELYERGTEGTADPVSLHADSPLAPVDVSLWLNQESGGLQGADGMLCEEMGNGTCMDCESVAADNGDLAEPPDRAREQEAVFHAEGQRTCPLPRPSRADSAGGAERPLHQQHRERFYEMMEGILSSKREGDHSYIDRDRHQALVDEAKAAKELSGKKDKPYQQLQRCNVLQLGGKEKLAVPPSRGRSDDVSSVQYEDLFDVLHAAHLTVGHGGWTRMLTEVSCRYKNVTVEAVMTYLKLCEPCQRKHAGLYSRVDPNGPFDRIYR